MVVPMIAAGELIGSVSFGGDQAHFPEEQVSIAREVATQLAIALGQARLVEKLKSSYAELQQAQAQLAQSQKMEAIGQLAGGIAHDFNNLLTVIGGRSSLLLMRMRPDDPARKDVDLIQATAQRAADLTRQLLAFSRKQVLEPKPINLKALVAGLTPILRRLIGEHIEIVIVSTDDAGQVMADPGQIEQVIVNLVVNARDAMPDGGTLTIETTTHTVPDAGRRGQDRDVPPGEYVTLSIRDTGCGMDAATMARIFEPFFTTKEPGKGTGLGLSTVHGIVHQSGGHLALDSAVGRGTTFTIYLPRVLDQVGPAAGRPESQPDLVGGSGTVLLVEDDEDLRRLTSEILQRVRLHRGGGRRPARGPHGQRPPGPGHRSAPDRHGDAGDARAGAGRPAGGDPSRARRCCSCPGTRTRRAAPLAPASRLEPSCRSRSPPTI